MDKNDKMISRAVEKLTKSNGKKRINNISDGPGSMNTKPDKNTYNVAKREYNLYLTLVLIYTNCLLDDNPLLSVPTSIHLPPYKVLRTWL